MNFLAWLLEEMDNPSAIARFAKIVFDDINNGCGSRKFTPVEWKNHFLLEHPDSADYLISTLQTAYTKYALSRNTLRRTL